MKPINIKDQQPVVGQRCNVYDVTYREWYYAYWERDGIFRLYNKGLGRILRIFLIVRLKAFTERYRA